MGGESSYSSVLHAAVCHRAFNQSAGFHAQHQPSSERALMALSLTLTRGTTGAWFLSIFEEDGVTPQDLTGSVIYFHAGLASPTFAIDKSSPSSSGITINDIAGGTDCATLVIDPADTTALPNTGIFGMPCELKLLVGSSPDWLLAKGTLEIQPNVGTP